MRNVHDFLSPPHAPGSPSLDEVRAWLPPATTRPRRLLLLSDIHANWPALVAVLEDARGRYDTIWFLGDIVGRGPHPVECTRFLRSCVSPRRWRAGNHDLGVLGRLAKFLYGFVPNERARRTWTIHEEQLRAEPELWYWLDHNVGAERIDPLVRRYGGRTQMFVHAVPHDPVGFNLFPNDWANILVGLRHLERAAPVGGDGALLLVGHTHMVCLARLAPGESMPWLQPIVYGEPVEVRDAFYLVNPGSVGQPRDGDPRAAYAILDAVRATVEFRRVTYNTRPVQRAMQRQGYPDELIEQLASARICETGLFESVYKRCDERGVIPRHSS